MINGLALCAGIGGIEIGISRVLEGYRTVCYIEREAYAAAVLVRQMEEGGLDKAPVWDDIETFDGRPWRGVVDILTAGLPCQPFSVAGKQQGEEDERYLWPQFFRILGEVQPALVFLENVPNFLAFFRPVGEELSEMGYEFEAGIFSASEVGATHRRERFFCLAHNGSQRTGILAQGLQERQSESVIVGNGHHSRCREYSRKITARQEFHSAEYSSLPAWPPGPQDPVWKEFLQRWPELAPALEAERRGNMGHPNKSIRERRPQKGREQNTACESSSFNNRQEETKSDFRRVASGLRNRVDRLRCLGNAVVPATAEKAFRTLLGRIS